MSKNGPHGLWITPFPRVPLRFKIDRGKTLPGRKSRKNC